MELTTERLLLRPWKAADYPVFAAMSADKAVMKYFPALLSRKDSNTIAQQLSDEVAQKGWGLWALEHRASQSFMGFVGLRYQEVLPIANTPFLEIAWRLSAAYWGQGYAKEAAERAVDFAFEHLKAQNLYAFTALVNLPSIKLMQRVGMMDTGQDFNHPALPKGHELERHCLYRITKTTWQQRRLNQV